MTTKTERIEVRADETTKARITEAAELLGEPVSAFVVRTALRRGRPSTRPRAQHDHAR